MMDKSETRKAAFATRKAAFAAGQGQAAEILADFLAAYRGMSLSGYMPMRTEIDPLSAMAVHQGPVGVPVIIAPATPLKFREWTPGCAMQLGEFGAEIPVEGMWIEPQIVIVPLLAFDPRGYRLGYGGGFYDRTLQLLRSRYPITAIGFGFSAQELPEVPIDEFDQRLNYMVTELGVRSFSQA